MPIIDTYCQSNELKLLVTETHKSTELKLHGRVDAMGDLY